MSGVSIDYTGVSYGGVQSETILALMYASLYPVPTISSPTSGQTGVSLTPTVTTVEGVARPYTLAKRSTTDQTGIAVDTDLIFNSVSDSDIQLDTNTGIFTLSAGVEYELTACPNLTAFSSPAGYVYFRWVLASDNTALPGGQSGSIIPASFTGNSGSQPVAKATYRPTIDTEVKVRTWTFGTGTCSLTAANSWATIQTTATKYIDYTTDKTQVQIKLNSTDVIVYDSGEVSGTSVNVSPALAANTAYSVRCRHKDLQTSNLTSWSSWISFTTTM